MSKEEFREELGRIDKANRAYDLFDNNKDGGVSVAELKRNTVLDSKAASLAVARVRTSLRYCQSPNATVGVYTKMTLHPLPPTTQSLC